LAVPPAGRNVVPVEPPRTTAVGVSRALVALEPARTLETGFALVAGRPLIA
jgi:hypothetical protein